MRTQIREFSPGDLTALEPYLPSGHHARRAEAHECGRATFLLAWHDDPPVGYLLLKWSGADEEIVHRLIGDCPELNAITVAADLRSRGIGTALIREAERRIHAQGLSRVGLAVGVGNQRARALYQRLGYEPWGHGSFEVSWQVPDNGRLDHETCTYMLKTLDLASSV